MNKLKKLLLGLPLLGFLLPGCSFHIEKGKDEQGLEFHLKDNKEYYVSGGTSTNLTEIVVPETFDGLPVTGIKWPGFQKQQMESITLPSTIKHLDNAVFYECTSLKSIVIPEGVTTISNIAFGKCTSLTSVLIPNSVNNIENGAFSECTSLECNEYDNAKYLGNPDNPYVALYKSKDDAIETCKINDNCKLILNHAFCFCEFLTEVEMPSSVRYIGASAFNYCVKLSAFNYKGTAAEWDAIEKEEYWNFNCSAPVFFNYDGASA